MNLFNYLMAKKGHNTSVRDDLFAYLLGKRTPKEVKTATGTTISISDVTREKIVSLTLSKESTQDGTPTPENPIEVKTVKGNVGITITNGTNTRNYTIPLGNNEIAGIGTYKDELIVDKNGKCWLNKKTIMKQISSNDIRNYVAVSQGSLFRTNSFDDIITSNFATKCNYYLGIANSGSRQNYNVYWNSSIAVRAFDFIDNRFDNLEDFKNWVDTVNLKILGILNEPQLIDLNYTVDLTLFNGVNNISNSDDMDMTLKYY